MKLLDKQAHMLLAVLQDTVRMGSDYDKLFTVKIGVRDLLWREIVNQQDGERAELGLEEDDKDGDTIQVIPDGKQG